MPVTVDCDITPSFKRWAYLSIPILSGALLFVLIQSWLALVVWLVASVALRSNVLSEIQPTRFRLKGDGVSLWCDDQKSDWQWLGEGRCSHAFIQWNLHDEQGQSFRLRIWKDSVTDASWRALHMAYRVNQSAATKQTS